MRGNHNYYVAFNKKAITQKDVIENMQGNLKLTYDYLLSKGLKLRVKYWNDGFGYDEGLKIIVNL